ncbi:MAG: small-conductance mechanosensitive channel [Paraglaciecola sp.]|jgi:small-conductance mechanosensitive channel
MTFQEFLNNLYRILNHKILGESYPDFSLKFILIAIVFILFGRLIIWSITNILTRFFKQRQIDSGRSFAFIQFTKYIIYTGIFIQALSIIGIKFTVIWGGAAALLVGIGLGLQQTFNDLISGLILLVEGTVEVGDIVEINGVVGTVINIGIRTSKIKSRDGISLLIPNSKLVGDSSTNWSHTVQTTRFQIKVGVAYSSDVQFVTNLLLDSVKNHPKILNKPEPRIQFKDFGNSSLDFEIHFFSNELLGIEFVKSDVRYKIMELFRVNNIEIPFPQQDIWFKNQIK